jgi:hypothetical protein
MSWVRLDDQFPDHPKVAGLSNEAFCLHVTAMCWTAKQQTDGKLPSRLLTRLAWRCQDPATAAAELIEAGVWDKTPEGWEIHDFLVYNPTKEQVAELAAKRSAAGVAGAMARWQTDGKPDGKPHGKQDSKIMPPSPSPSPSPIPDPIPGELTATPSANADKRVNPGTLGEWHDLLRTDTNKVAVLRRMFDKLFPDAVDIPDYARLGKTAKQVGGAGRLAELMWTNSAKPPSGDVMAYLVRVSKNGAGPRNDPKRMAETQTDYDALKARYAPKHLEELIEH